MVVLNVPLCSLARRNRFVVPALRVHRIDAEGLQVAVFVLIADVPIMSRSS